MPMPESSKPHDVEDSSRREASVLEQDVDPAFERKLKWKLDLFILPIISSVFFFASMVGPPVVNLALLNRRSY